MSKELGIGQQLVAKHLETMQDSGVVTSSMETSPVGPSRREYLLTKSISVTIDFAPNLFNTRIVSFDTLPGREVSEEVSSLMRRVDEIIRYHDESSRIDPLANLLARIDKKLNMLEDERTVLLYIRNLMMKVATKAIKGLDKTTDSKKVLYYVLDEQDISVSGISKSLNLREAVVRQIIADLRRDSILR